MARQFKFPADPTDDQGPSDDPQDGLDVLSSLFGVGGGVPQATVAGPDVGRRNNAVTGALSRKYGLRDDGSISQKDLEGLDAFFRGADVNDKIATSVAPIEAQGENAMALEGARGKNALDVENLRGQYGLQSEAMKDASARSVASIKADPFGAGGTGEGNSQIDFWANQAMGDTSLLQKLPAAEKAAVVARMAQLGGSPQTLTNQTRQMSEAANDLLPVIPQLGDMASQFQKQGIFQPGVGVLRSWLAKQGLGNVAGLMATAETTPATYVDPQSGDSYTYASHKLVPVAGAPPNIAQAIGRFNSMLGLFQSGLARAHAGARGAGNSEIAKRFEEMLPATGDLDTFLGSLQGTEPLLRAYAAHTNPAYRQPAGASADPYADPNYQPK